MRPQGMIRGAKAAGVIVLGALVFGAAVMLLWNAIIPDLFHGPVIAYWQAVGLLVLTHILFRGGSVRLHAGPSPKRMKQRFEEKLATMAPEEREKFRAEWKRRCDEETRTTV